MVHAAAHVAAGIAVLETARKNLIESRSGDHSELSAARDCLSETPVGDGNAHATLDDRG